MEITESIILGLVQGATEFLPVSSSGHLWIFETLIFHMKSSVAFEAFLHLSTLFAVIVFFWKKLWKMLIALFNKKKNPADAEYSWKLLLATLFTFPIAYALKPFVEQDLTKNIVAITLGITGILVLISEYFSPKKSIDFSWRIAAFLGIAQSISVIPGISRSGITIVFLLLAGIERKKAVEISFLLSIPTILGAFIFLIPELKDANFDLPVLFAAGTVAFFAAILTIWAMLKTIEKYWKWFSVWCFVVAGGLLVI